MVKPLILRQFYLRSAERSGSVCGKVFAFLPMAKVEEQADLQGEPGDCGAYGRCLRGATTNSRKR